ncbi:MAG: Stk1 family PASTA domain-containing Ser/Thr kinase [Lachnospiraceae bacterium]|nr:Stk1 family PASTA domain-containing Ser/Thr kinase [Lachnospiraceae bacterium]
MIRKGMFLSNRYEILEKVGSGGMSDVYKAKCHKLNRFVAIKVLKSEFSEDKNFVTKFRAEAQNAAGLAHPNIVSVYDVGVDRGMYYIVMELIEGITLKQYIARKKRLSVKEAVSISIQVAQGIECAHNNNIIHRDIKPQNVIISRDGKVKVADFGIARATSVNTHTTNAMGSVHYISPEQASNGKVDEKSDIYSLGITMFEMLTGHVPFDGDSTVTIALQHIQKQVPRLSEELPNIPLSVEKIVLKCTQNVPERRYLKISSLIMDLKRALLNPDDDFVKLDEEQKNDTVIVSKEDQITIKNAAGKEEKLRASEDADSEKSPFDDEEPPSTLEKVLMVLGIGIVLLFLGVAIAMIPKIFLDGGENNRNLEIETTTLDPTLAIVPNLYELSEEDARTALHNNALGIKYQYDYDDNVEKGFVCAQSEEANAIIEKNSTITVTISNGAERILLPSDIDGKDVEAATLELNNVGFEVEVVYTYSSSNIGTVLSHDPDGKVELSKGTVITLTVSRGKEANTEGISLATVPSVAGKSRSNAESALKNAGFRIGEVKEVYSEVAQAGTVIRMTVKPGVRLPYGSKVGMVVSLGSENPETETFEEVTSAEEVTTVEETSAQATYSASYTFSLEDMLDANGEHLTSGAIAIYVDGKKVSVDPAYSRLETWPGDYTYTVIENYSGTANLQLYVNNAVIVDTQIELK